MLDRPIFAGHPEGRNSHTQRREKIAIDNNAKVSLLSLGSKYLWKVMSYGYLIVSIHSVSYIIVSIIQTISLQTKDSILYEALRV